MDSEPGRRTGTASNTVGPSRGGLQVLRYPPSWKVNLDGLQALVGSELVPHGMGFDCSAFRSRRDHTVLLRTEVALADGGRYLRRSCHVPGRGYGFETASVPSCSRKTNGWSPDFQSGAFGHSGFDSRLEFSARWCQPFSGGVIGNTLGSGPRIGGSSPPWRAILGRRLVANWVLSPASEGSSPSPSASTYPTIQGSSNWQDPWP